MQVPTLNLEVASAPTALRHGIYACWVIFDDKRHRGALHYGPRPVFHDPSPTLEVHLIDATLPEAPQNVTVEVIARLRDVLDFADPQELQRAMQQDIDRTRAMLEEP